MRDTSVAVDRGTISVWYRPSLPGNPTVTLLHGLTGTSRWWLPVISRLPEKLGVIAPDLAGRGQSWRAGGPYDLSSLAVDISLCLNHFEVPKTTLAGYSMGAWLASLYTESRRHRVEGVLLVDGGFPLPSGDDSEPERVVREMLGPTLDRLDRAYPTIEDYLAFWRAHPALAGRWTEELDTVFGYELREEGGEYRVRANPEAIREGARSFLFDEQANKAIYELAAPALLLCAERGTMDQPTGFVPEGVVETALIRNPHLEAERVPDLNHYTLLMGAGSARVAGAIVGLL